MAGARAKRNHITKYMDTLPEEFETVEDNLDSEEPSIKLQTKTRIITLSCDESGRVIESFRMRRGAGSKDEFLAKQEAYTAIRTYYDNYYTGATIKQSSFDEGYIKIELEEKIVTLTYDTTTKTVEEKDRARRGTKNPRMLDSGKEKQIPDEGKTKLLPEQLTDSSGPTKIFEEPFELDMPPIYPKIGDAISISEPDPKFAESLSVSTTHHAGTKSLEEKPKRHRRTKAEMQAAREADAKQEEVLDPNQTTLDQFFDKEYIGSKSHEDNDIKIDISEKTYDKIPEGTIVRNNYSGKDYKVVKVSNGNTVEVFDKEHGYLTMARADIKVMVNIPGM